MSDGRQQVFSFFRITVLGHSESGKTCLINSFVNNTCPTVHTATDDPQIYYRTMRIPDPLDEAPDFEVLLEIEDVWGSDRGKNGEKDRWDQPRKIEDFLSPIPDATRGSKASPQLVFGQPFKDREAPKAPGKEPWYKPMTRRRMGFLIVFAVDSEASLMEAVHLCDLLATDEARKAKERASSMGRNAQREEMFSDHNQMDPALAPVVYLVGNKIDLEQETSTSDENKVRKHRMWAERWCAQMNDKKMLQIRYKEVSAFEYHRGTRKMWWDMIEDIRERPKLWKTDEDAHGEEGVAASAAENCVLQ
jgi:GTPase SAR1 family protein